MSDPKNTCGWMLINSRGDYIREEFVLGRVLVFDGPMDAHRYIDEHHSEDGDVMVRMVWVDIVPRPLSDIPTSREDLEMLQP